MGKGIRTAFLISVAFFVAAAILFGYRPLLRYSAKVLMVTSDTAPADAIVILGGGEPGRAREAVDLYLAKLGRYVVVTVEPLPVSPAEMEEYRKYGIELLESNENSLRVLRGMGVPDANIIATYPPVSDTLDEMQRIHQLSKDRNWKKVLIVTSNYHTRRARLAARQVLGPDVQAVIVGSKYGGIDAENWWKNTGDIRTVLIELQKLAVYTIYAGVF